MPNQPSTSPSSSTAPITIAAVTAMPRPPAPAPTIAASIVCMASNRARITSRPCIKRHRARPAPKSRSRKDSLGNPLPELSYAVTFFPEAQKMSDAVPLKVGPGEEVAGIDIFLTLVHTVHVRGRVIGALEGGAVSQPQRRVALERFGQYRFRRRSYQRRDRQGPELRYFRRHCRAISDGRFRRRGRNVAHGPRSAECRRFGCRQCQHCRRCREYLERQGTCGWRRRRAAHGARYFA